MLYLIFTEGHTASSGESLARVDLSAEAIRLTRQLHDATPDASGETTGLLALMLLTDARRAARTDAAGALVPLDEQDRSRWDRAMIDEGVALVTEVLDRAPIGPYQLQAAIAAVHDEAAVDRDDRLDRDPRPLRPARPTRAGPDGDARTHRRARDGRGTRGRPRRARPRRGDADGTGATLAEHHRTWAVRAHLLERSGATDAASLAFAEAARRTLNGPEQRYLAAKAETLRAAR